MNKLITLVQLSKNSILEKIKMIEIDYAFEIPLEFKNLLLEYNVCKPSKSFYKNGKLQFNLNYFFGITEDPNQSLLESFKTYLNRMPEEIFPIGSVDGGDLLCMNKRSGELYNWFHEEHDWGLEGINKWPVMVAQNMGEYLNQLILSELPTQQEIEIAKRDSKVKITPMSVKIRNEQREQQGLHALSFEEWEALLNG